MGPRSGRVAGWAERGLDGPGRGSSGGRRGGDGRAVNALQRPDLDERWDPDRSGGAPGGTDGRPRGGRAGAGGGHRAVPGWGRYAHQHATPDVRTRILGGWNDVHVGTQWHT